MIIQNVTNQATPPSQAALPAPVVSSAVADTSKASAPIVAVEPAPLSTEQVSPEVLKNAVSVINQVLQLSSSNLQFTVDNETKKPIIRLVDTKTGELIRQIPSEETLAISRSIDAALQRQGLLFQQVA